LTCNRLQAQGLFEQPGGFGRKPDAFDAAHLPAPGKKGGK
jgi:hypothetical protein